MPHKSRLSSFVIDCKTDDLEAATTFWTQALGRTAEPDEDPRYKKMTRPDDQYILLLQKVDHPGRVHLDIESDDVEAEVTRLEALGARRIEKIRTWVVMEAPTGQRFCVIRLQRGPLGDDATQWP